MARPDDAHPASGSRRTALALAELLVEHQAEETVVLDVRRQSGWTDYFVIATTRSQAHLRGVLRHLDVALRRMGDAGRERPGHSLRRAPDDSGWVLLDLGSVVVHLMTEEQRRFYELERLWFRSPAVFRDSGSRRDPDTPSSRESAGPPSPSAKASSNSSSSSSSSS